MKRTLVFGASTNPARYSFMAAHMLQEHHFDFELVGRRSEILLDKQIKLLKDQPVFDNIHTITLYVNPMLQNEYLDYILGLKPSRIIFNPGTENQLLYNKASEAQIECLEACTLVLLSTGQF